RKMLCNQGRKLLGDIAPHAVVGRPGLLGRVDVEPRAEPEIPRSIGIVRNAFTAGARVRSYENDPMLGAGGAELTLFNDIGVSAGQARKVPEHRQRLETGRAQ